MERISELNAQAKSAAVKARKMFEGTAESVIAWLAIMQIEQEIVALTTPESEEGKQARIDTISCAVHAERKDLGREALAKFISEGNVLPETIERIQLFLRD